MAIGIKTGGRRKGSKNKITKELQSVIKDLLEEEMKLLPDYLDRLDPKERVEVVIKETVQKSVSKKKEE